MDTCEDHPVDEITTLTAIYPEIHVADTNPHSFSLKVPVKCLSPITVRFKNSHSTVEPQPGVQIGQIPNNDEVYDLTYLPSLLLTFDLPPGYPLSEAPKVAISENPPWLSPSTRAYLEAYLVTLWEDYGRSLVCYAYIDHIQSEAERLFGLSTNGNALEFNYNNRAAIIEFDRKAKRAEFERQTFTCGICLDNKRGAVCHKMRDCGHVFCVKCLQEFYTAAITSGDIVTVRCLTFGCAREREKQRVAIKNGLPEAAGKRKPKIAISPSELLQIPIKPELVGRYIKLKYKIAVESDRNTVYCPRKWCQGPATSKRHKKPVPLEDIMARMNTGNPGESNDTDDEDDDDNGDYQDEDNDDTSASANRLAICEDCGFAFCRRCQRSWHGEFVRCMTKEEEDELKASDRATSEWLLEFTAPCPTCDARCQKSSDCNHMTCFRCQTHFCYICSAWLPPENPYAHFNVDDNNKKTSCFQRLWERTPGQDPDRFVEGFRNLDDDRDGHDDEHDPE